MAYIHGLLKIILYADGVSKTKMVESLVSPLAIIDSLMHLLGPLSFPTNLVKVALYLSNSNQLTPIASNASKNIMSQSLCHLLKAFA